MTDENEVPDDELAEAEKVPPAPGEGTKGYEG